MDVLENHVPRVLSLPLRHHVTDPVHGSECEVAVLDCVARDLPVCGPRLPFAGNLPAE